MIEKDQCLLLAFALFTIYSKMGKVLGGCLNFPTEISEWEMGLSFAILYRNLAWIMGLSSGRTRSRLSQ